MNTLNQYLAESHIEDLQRDARRAAARARALEAIAPQRETPAAPITIRRATHGDAAGLKRVAALDSSEVPAQPVLVAVLDAEVRAAVSLADGAIVADPFHPTAAIVELLETYAYHERADRRNRARRWLRRSFRDRGRLARRSNDRRPAFEIR